MFGDISKNVSRKTFPYRLQQMIKIILKQMPNDFSMKDKHLSYSSKNAEELVELGQLAYETLDNECKAM